MDGESGTAVIERDFPLFGGNTTITFNDIIPIFNIESIKDVRGREIFYAECIGRLASSDDKSFAEYPGYDGVPKDKSRNFRRRRSDTVNVSYGGQEAALDAAWTQSMDNLWFLGDAAMLSMAEVPVPAGERHALRTLARRYSEGIATYALFRHRTEETAPSVCRLMNVFVDGEENVTRDFKILTQREDGGISVLTLTVFDSVYKKNRSYFRKILESYSVN